MGSEPSPADRARDVDAQVRFHKRHVTVVNGVHGVLVQIDPDDLQTVGGQDGCRGQPDVTQADDGDRPDARPGLGSSRCQHVRVAFRRI